jgi:hypothetical protein
MRVISGEGAFARLVEEMRWLERGARDGAPWPLVPLPRRTAGGAPRACHYRPAVGLIVVPACFGGGDGAAGGESGAGAAGAGRDEGAGAAPGRVPGPAARATAAAAALVPALRRALAEADARDPGGAGPPAPRVAAATPSALFLAPRGGRAGPGAGPARSVFTSDASAPPRPVAKGAEFAWVVVGGPVFFGWAKDFGLPEVANASIAGLVYDPLGLWAWRGAGLPLFAPDGVPAPDWPDAGEFAPAGAAAGPEALADAAALRSLVAPFDPRGDPADAFLRRPCVGCEFALRVDEKGRALLRGATRRPRFPRDAPPPGPPRAPPGARCHNCGRRLVGVAYALPAEGAPGGARAPDPPPGQGAFRCADCAERLPGGSLGRRVAAPSAAEACAGEHPHLAALDGAPAETLAPGLAWRVKRVLVAAPALGAWPALTCRAARDALESGAVEAVVTGLSLA